MNNFKGGGFNKGAPKFGGKKKFTDNKKFGGGHGRDTRTPEADTEMFSATCSDCGKSCNVPFRPSSEKPVYCSECFGMKKSANEPRGSKHAEKRSHTPTHISNHSQSNANAVNNTRGVSNDVITDLKRQITAWNNQCVIHTGHVFPGEFHIDYRTNDLNDSSATHDISSLLILWCLLKPPQRHPQFLKFPA